MFEYGWVTPLATLVGILVGLTGVGAGALMTPLLIVTFNVEPSTAIATDLIYAATTKLVISWRNLKHGFVSWEALRLVLPGSLLGAAIGTFLIMLALWKFQPVMTYLIAIAIAITSFSLFFEIENAKEIRLSKMGTFLSGLAVGFGVSTTSVGAGALGVVIFRNLISKNDPKRLIATDILHAIPIALLAGFSYLIAGLCNLTLLGYMLLGSIPGALLGSRLAARSKPRILKKILASVLMVSATLLMLKGIIQ